MPRPLLAATLPLAAALAVSGLLLSRAGARTADATTYARGSVINLYASVDGASARLSRHLVEGLTRAEATRQLQADLAAALARHLTVTVSRAGAPRGTATRMTVSARSVLSAAPLVLPAPTRGSALRAVVRQPGNAGASTLDTVIVVHTGASSLEVFTRGRRTQVLQVATGQPGYPSPHGTFRVVAKQPAPSW